MVSRGRGFGYGSSSRSPDYSSMRGGYSSERDTDTTRDQKHRSISKEKRIKPAPTKRSYIDLPKQMKPSKPVPMSQE